MEGQKHDTYLYPHIHVKKLDESGVMLSIFRNNTGIVCFNYTCGIKLEFELNTDACVIAKYIVDCLDKNTAYTMSTNMGTRVEKLAFWQICVWLTSALQYMMAIKCTIPGMKHHVD